MKKMINYFNSLIVILLSVLLFNSCKDGCEDTVCENGSVCIEGECISPYEACNPNPCKNGGTCNEDGTCDCPVGYLGVYCEQSNNTGNLVITTATVSNINNTTAVSGGNIVGVGNSPIIQRGVCWSTAPNPTISNNKSTDGTGTGSFISTLSALSPNTVYFLRAYAINNQGAIYGNQLSFTTTSVNVNNDILNPSLSYGTVSDIDGNVYATIAIGPQIWMAENLRTTRYANGEPIPNITDNFQWNNTTIGAWSYYDNNSSFNNTYGKLYNWYTVADPRNVCPVGWHVPITAEWEFLVINLGGYNVAGGKMKSTGTQYWQPQNISATNESGFSGLPGGNRDYLGFFFNQLNYGNWWTSDGDDINNIGFLVSLDYSQPTLLTTNFFKNDGISVRCVKD
jgi:uncharacterized protein (TIGR02145 family)